MHILQDTLRTCPYILLNVLCTLVISVELVPATVLNCAQLCSTVMSNSKSTPSSSRSKEERLRRRRQRKGLAVLPKGTITALVPTISQVRSDHLGIYMHIQLAQVCPPRPCIHQVSIIGASLSEPHIDEFAGEFLSLSLSLYIYIVHRAVSHFQLLFCVFLCHSLIQNYSQTTQQEDTNRLPS